MSANDGFDLRYSSSQVRSFDTSEIGLAVSAKNLMKSQ
jgi:hypothetical protein